MPATSGTNPKFLLRSWFVPTDIDGFFQLFVDNLCQLIVVVVGIATAWLMRGMQMSPVPIVGEIFSLLADLASGLSRPFSLPWRCPCRAAVFSMHILKPRAIEH